MELKEAIDFMDDKIYWGTKGYETEKRTKAWEIIKAALRATKDELPCRHKWHEVKHIRDWCSKCGMIRDISGTRHHVD